MKGMNTVAHKVDKLKIIPVFVEGIFLTLDGDFSSLLQEVSKYDVCAHHLTFRHILQTKDNCY